MASAADKESEKIIPVPTSTSPPPETKGLAAAPPATSAGYFPVVNVVLRFLLFASGLVSVVVMVTSKQTEITQIPFPPFRAPVSAKFSHSPAFIYFVAALSVAGFYGLISTLVSIYALLKPSCSTKILSHFVIFDVLLLGIVASATGAAGGVAYIGLKGNTHTAWRKVCNVYGDFCRHIGGSVAVSLFGSIVLVLLVILSIHSISKKIPK
ncbi:hypothetical protein M9H77_36685 [Catharanthus roseus]|uniref:Uncharacterized protein n=1 Tax=Catharanthus roseus TaxID=4058 RepID=A0ACB9ZWA0_CATRO|nr:hypothetical protein M9H77_36685 [Catharanthus roseus]